MVAVEIKLVAELHVVYGRTPRGTRGQVAAAYVAAWGARRGVDQAPGMPALGVVLGAAARQQLRRRLARRLGRNLTTMGPLLSGAAVASYLNRRATRGVGENVQKDLRKKRPALP